MTPKESQSWGYNKVIKFINLLRSYPVLWDTKDSQFRNKFQREIAYDELSFEMNTTNAIVKRKIHTLRSQYLVELKKLKSNKNYKPCWQYFNQCRFIYKHEDIDFETQVTFDDCKKPRSNIDDESSNTQESQDFIDDNESQYDDNATSSFCDERSKSTSQVPAYKANEDIEDKSTANQLLRKRCHSRGAQSDNESSKRTKKEAAIDYNNSSQIQDDFTIFGENIANELRLLRGHHSIHDALKLKIVRAIKEARYALHKARVNT